MLLAKEPDYQERGHTSQEQLIEDSNALPLEKRRALFCSRLFLLLF
jgi:hypothetical protein